MKFKFFARLILLMVLLSIPIAAQQSGEKYFIYFRDKGATDNYLMKGSDAYQEALSLLSQEAIERRKAVLGEDNIIGFEDLPLNTDYVQQLESAGITIHHQLRWFNAVSAYLTPQQRAQVSNFPFVEKLEKVKSFSSVRLLDPEESNIYQPELNKNFTDYGESYVQLQMNEIPEVHRKGITGQGVILGILDTGFDWKLHNSLKTRNVVSEYDFVFGDNVTANEDEDSPSQHNHGTYVFSIAGGFHDSVLIGAAYNASFLLAKTEYVPTEKNIEEDNYAAALQWMESRGVKITSSSLGYNTFDAGQTSYTYNQMDGKTTIVTRAAELAFSKGVLTITAAGNEGNGLWKYIVAPADGFNTIAIGAVTSLDSVASFSGIGPTPDGRIKPELVAMGVNTYGARASTPNQYQSNSGTSAATPIASGAAALVWSAFPHLTNKQVRNLLISTAGSFKRPNFYRGYGLINVKKALELPAVKNTPGGIVAEKIFFDSVYANYGAYIFISKNNRDFDSVKMIFDGGFKYQAALSALPINVPIFFYIKYESAPGKYTTLPEGGTWYSPDPSESEVRFEPTVIIPELTLEQNYPNPFNIATAFRFYTSVQFVGEIVIYNLLGQKVKTMYSGSLEKGTYSMIWNGLSDDNIPVASGAYIYSVSSSGMNVYKKMMLLK
ncbi:MAG: S8 family serine peptidase [Ignavibacteriaceae bacterium]|nr:S8 family serine peptidase [Ignavibacteriaceae bacterium]